MIKFRLLLLFRRAMEITYKLEVFEGPLDLLLHLIEKNKIDIYDIPIVLITEQFLSYMDNMDRSDPERVSSFIVMAAMLLRIKSKMLLPKEDKEEDPDFDPREELIQRLLEYQRFKALSYELKDRQIEAQQIFYGKKSIPKEIESFKEEPDLDKMLEGITLEKLKRVFEEVMQRSEEKIDPIRSNFGKIEKESISLSERIQEVELLLKENATVSFRWLLGEKKTKNNIIVTFLALLEMMKLGSIHIIQEHIFDEIQIQHMVHNNP